MLPMITSDDVKAGVNALGAMTLDELDALHARELDLLNAAGDQYRLRRGLVTAINQARHKSMKQGNIKA